MELVPRTTAPHHATGVVEFVPLTALAADATFRLRAEGDVSALAGSIARLGQLVPVEVRPVPPAPGAAAGPARYQVVAGFRRLAAVRLLARERVLARVHGRLDDSDAWSVALSQALLGEPLDAASLEALRGRLEGSRVAPWALELIDEARVRAPVDPELRERFLAFLEGAPAGAPPGPDGDEDAAADEAAAGEPPVEASAEAAADEEVTPEELAEQLAVRLWEVNQDLSLAVDAWAELPEEGRRLILEQVRYMAELHPFLTRGRR